jgi:geranylgeranyl pyrophosphate synthase
MKMAKVIQGKLMKEVINLLEEKGRKAFLNAKEIMLREKFQCDLLREAINYFMDNWQDFQHPALLSLVCEAFHEYSDVATEFGTALVLLASAADIHDDIIDQSLTKSGKLTVLGKFDKNVALLAGDFLLFKGLTILHNACQKIREPQRQKIMKLTENAFLKIAFAETKEAECFGKYYLNPEEYFQLFEMKAAVAELTMRIGAIIGGGTAREINAIGNYGRTLGILMAVRDDYIDMFEPDELKNRFKNECLPLPILYAFQDKKAKEIIVSILKKDKISDADAYNVAKTVIESKGFQVFRRKIRLIFNEGLNYVKLLNKNLQTTLIFILKASIEDIF